MRPVPLPAFEDNYIWSLTGDAGEAVVVDPGDAAPVLAAADAGLRPVAVLVTHHHPDHAGGLAALRARWPGLTIHAPHDARIAIECNRVRGGDRVDAAGFAFDVIDVPGHTTSHIAFNEAQRQWLFSGDTLFSLGCGRMFEGTPVQMLASLDRLAALPGTTEVYCGHEYTVANARFALALEPGNERLRARAGEATALRAAGQPTLPIDLATERATNPFLRVREPSLQAALAAHGAGDALDAVAAFAAMRLWKDGFKG